MAEKAKSNRSEFAVEVHVGSVVSRIIYALVSLSRHEAAAIARDVSEEVSRILDGNIDDFRSYPQSLREPRQSPSALLGGDVPIDEGVDPTGRLLRGFL